jgi:hypothetical protein
MYSRCNTSIKEKFNEIMDRRGRGPPDGYYNGYRYSYWRYQILYPSENPVYRYWRFNI